jgi:hypothetical protein
MQLSSYGSLLRAENKRYVVYSITAPLVSNPALQ